jgi:hypothetical protein
MENKEVQMLNDLIAKDHAVEEAENALLKAQIDFWETFKSKKNWKVFAKRHGMDRDFDFDRMEIEEWDANENDNIRMNFIIKFHGETECYSTHFFPKKELVDFLSSDDYYADIFAKEKEEKERAKKLKEEDDRKKRKKMYEELKKEFENE